MLQLALEIPTVMLSRWEPLTDLSFVIAHKVLEDSEHAKFFQQRDWSRPLILDNATHEFGKPMPLERLLQAAKLCKANFVVAPDIINERMPDAQHALNVHWLEQTSKELSDWSIGAVWSGLRQSERSMFLHEASCLPNVEMLMLTFHLSWRLLLWDELVRSPSFKRERWKRVHLLGMLSLKETREWVKISERHPDVTFSFDTSKPLKLGVQGLHLADAVNLRGGPIRSKEVLDLTSFTDEQTRCVEENIHFLKAVCRGEA